MVAKTYLQHMNSTESPLALCLQCTSSKRRRLQLYLPQVRSQKLFSTHAPYLVHWKISHHVRLGFSAEYQKTHQKNSFSPVCFEYKWTFKGDSVSHRYLKTANESQLNLYYRSYSNPIPNVYYQELTIVLHLCNQKRRPISTRQKFTIRIVCRRYNTHRVPTKRQTDNDAQPSGDNNNNIWLSTDFDSEEQFNRYHTIAS